MADETGTVLGAENSDSTANSDVDTTKDTEQKDTAQNDTETKDKDTLQENGDDKSPDEDEVENNSQDSDEQNDDGTDNGADDEIFLTTADGQTIKKSDAVDLCYKGLEFNQKYAPILEKLDLLATSSKKADGTDYSDVGDFVETLLGAADNALYNDCLDAADGNEEIAEELFESRKAKRNANYNEVINKRKADAEKNTADKTAQVAEEFEILQKEFPEIKSYADLPKEVKQYAAKNSVSLLTAKLLIDHRNQNAIEKATANADKASKSSLGSQSGSSDESVSPAIKAMLDRFR